MKTAVLALLATVGVASSPALAGDLFEKPGPTATPPAYSSAGRTVLEDTFYPASDHGLQACMSRAMGRKFSFIFNDEGGGSFSTGCKIAPK